MDRSSRIRCENSLGLLTKRFIKLIQQSPNQTIDLNHAYHHLKVQKRRIYDITNVLQGTGFVSKVQKNNVQWIAENKADIEFQQNGEQLIQRIEHLTTQQQKLEQQIQNITSSIQQQFRNHKYSNLFVTLQDIMQIQQQLINTNQNSLMLFVKTDEESQVQIQQTEQNKKQVKIISKSMSLK